MELPSVQKWMNMEENEEFRGAARRCGAKLSRPNEANAINAETRTDTGLTFDPRGEQRSAYHLGRDEALFKGDDQKL